MVWSSQGEGRERNTIKIAMSLEPLEEGLVLLG